MQHSCLCGSLWWTRFPQPEHSSNRTDRLPAREHLRLSLQVKFGVSAIFDIERSHDGTHFGAGDRAEILLVGDRSFIFREFRCERGNGAANPTGAYLLEQSPKTTSSSSANSTAE